MPTYLLEGEGDTGPCSTGTEHNMTALTSGKADTTDITVSVSGLQTPKLSEVEWASSTSEPGESDWPSGDYVFSLNIVTAGSSTTGYLRLNQRQSSCTGRDAPLGGVADTSFTSTGTHTHTVSSYDPASGAATDRFCGEVLFENTGHTNKTWVLEENDSAGSFLTFPDVAGGGAGAKCVGGNVY